MKKKICCLLLCLFAFFAVFFMESLQEAAANEEEPEFKFKITEDDTVTITRLMARPMVTHLVIPKKIQNTEVTTIANRALANGNFESIVIPDTITTIGTGVFDCCSKLKKIEIPASVTSFCYNQNTGLVDIGEAKNMTEIVVAEDNPVYSSLNGVLYNKDKTELLCVPYGYEGELIIPDTVEKMNDNALRYRAKLTRLHIPEKLTGLSGSLLLGCSSLEYITVDEKNTDLKSVDGVLYQNTKNLQLLKVPAKAAGTYYEIPEGVVYLDTNALHDCEKLKVVKIPASMKASFNPFTGCSSLQEITVAEENKVLKAVDGVMYNKDGTVLLAYPRSYPISAFVVPEGVTDIGFQAFMRCSTLKNISFSSSLRCISGNAFFECNFLEKLIVSENVTEIGENCFYNSAGLKCVVLPGSLQTLGEDAFSECNKLKTVEAGRNTEEIWMAIEQEKEWKLVYPAPDYRVLRKELLPEDGIYGMFTYRLTVDGELVLTGVTEQVKERWEANSLVIPSTLVGLKVLAIAEGAFSYLDIAEVSLPTGLLEIGKGAFYGCNLQSVQIPDTVTCVGERAFGANYCLKNIEVEELNQTYVSKDGVLYTQDGLMLVQVPANYQAKEYVVPEGVLVIGEYAFGNNRTLEHIFLPDSVIKIENKAFWNVLRAEVQEVLEEVR